MRSSLCLNLLIPLEIRAKTYGSHLGISTLHTTEKKLSTISCTRINDSQRTTTTNQQLNLSVLRFTLGIPGLDESYLPGWIGYAFGSLLLLNHFVGSDSTTTMPAQLRSEVLGLSLAGFSIILPYLGKFLQGATRVDQTIVPESAEQIFVMSQDITDNAKEDLAWGTYALLRNTNTISVLISIQDALCVRGYWNTPGDVSKDDALDWFQKQIQRIGLSDLKDTLYFPQRADPELWEMLPKGTRSLLVQPVPQAPKGSANQVEKTEGFILLASSISYAYSDKDRAWMGAVANKFRGLGASEIDYTIVLAPNLFILRAFARSATVESYRFINLARHKEQLLELVQSLLQLACQPYYILVARELHQDDNPNVQPEIFRSHWHQWQDLPSKYRKTLFSNSKL